MLCGSDPTTDKPDSAGSPLHNASQVLDSAAACDSDVPMDGLVDGVVQDVLAVVAVVLLQVIGPPDPVGLVPLPTARCQPHVTAAAGTWQQSTV